jgi:hypothetical protein
MKVEPSRSDHIDADEKRESDYQHPKQLEIVISQKPQMRTGIRMRLVLHHEAISAEEEENRHSIMTEIRKQVHWQEFIGMCQHFPQAIVVRRKELILVLL